MSLSDVNTKKKEIDKLILESIRICIVNEEQEKVFSYIDQLSFTQSLKYCIKLCESLQAYELSQKVGKYLQEKEQKEILVKSYQTE